MFAGQKGTSTFRIPSIQNDSTLLTLQQIWGLSPFFGPLFPRGDLLRRRREVEWPRRVDLSRVSFLEQKRQRRYAAIMKKLPPALSTEELAERLRGFCERYHIRRLEVFGSVAHGNTTSTSDVDLLVTLDESVRVSTADLLEMAGEAEELVGAPVDFVLRSSLERSPNRYAREHILGTAVRVYGS